ncbi:MAG TPA: site-specific integrase [Thermoanaerobaculia bacterium]|nr:site-specific integrase [Thermoanaerobaculia bacterium]
MPRGQTNGWKLLRNVPKETPAKPVRVSTGIWFTQHRTFAAYVYLHGKSVFIGSYPTVQEAEDARQERVQEGKKGTALVARSKSRLRLDDLKELYLSETAADWKESTRRAALARYNCHIKASLGEIPLRDLTFEQLSKFRGELLRKEVSGQTKREVLMLLRAILRDAVRRSYIASSPAELLELPSKQASIVSVPPYEVAVKAIAAIHDSIARMLADLILNTGLRINEAIALTWPDINFDAQKITVQRSIDQVSGKIIRPKTQKSIRRVDLPDAFTARLREYHARQEAGEILKNEPWLFPVSETPCDPNGSERPPVLNDRNFSQRDWHPALATVTPMRFGMHALRHLYASKLLSRGAALKYVSSQLGHTSAAFTMTQYIHFLPENEEQKRWLNAAFA